MKLTKKIIITSILLCTTNLIFSVRPTIEQVLNRGDSVFNWASEYYDMNCLSSISKQFTNFLPIALNNDLKGFNETADQLDEYFQEAWHDIYK